MATNTAKKWMTEPVLIEKYLFWALKANFKLTEPQFRKWLKWNLQQDDFNMHPTKFVSDVTGLSYVDISKRIHEYDDLHREKLTETNQ